MINGTIKIRNKGKTQDFTWKPLRKKTMSQKESFTINLRDIIKYNGIGNKPKFIYITKKNPSIKVHTPLPQQILIFFQLFLFTKVVPRAFGSDINSKPNSSHKKQQTQCPQIENRKEEKRRVWGFIFFSKYQQLFNFYIIFPHKCNG